MTAHLDIDETYARVEKYISSNGGAAVDPERVRAHAIVVAFLAPNPSDGPWHWVMDLHPTNADAWRVFGSAVGPVVSRVSASLEHLGYTVEALADQPAYMRAKRP